MTDISVISACLGIFAGWGVAWMFARNIPTLQVTGRALTTEMMLGTTPG